MITQKTIKSNQSINTITSKEALSKLISNALSKNHLSIDIEGNRFFRYPERVCLIQVSFDNQAHIISSDSKMDSISPEEAWGKLTSLMKAGGG